MRWKTLFGLLLIGFGLMGACRPSPRPTPAPVLPNRLVRVEGKVWLRRVGWRDFLPAGFGVVVRPGDLLRVAEGSVAAVFCGEASLWEANPRLLPADGAEHSVPCPAGRPPRPWPDVSALRKEQDSDIPYVVQPRNTALLSDRPRLRWHLLPRVDTYTVIVIGDDGKNRPPVQVMGGETAWPEEWPPLEPGATYVLVVEGGGRRSDESNKQHIGLGFHLLPTQTAETIRAIEAQLRARPLTPTAADFLVAELYLNHELRAEAAMLLEGLVASDGTPAVWLALGRVYLESGLPLEARNAFEQALAAAQSTGEREAEAAAQLGLGLAARLLDDEAAAEEHLKTARALYERIGDREGLEQADRLLGGR